MKGNADLWAFPPKLSPTSFEGKAGKRWQGRPRPLDGLRNYCNVTTLHGLRNAAAEGITWFERLAWLSIFVVCCGLTVSMMASVWWRHQETPTMTSIETNHHPIVNVPFPAVTVCNTNVVLRSSAGLMADKFASHGVDREVALEFLRDLPQAFNAMRPFRLEDKTALLGAMRRLGYTLETLMFEVAQPCEQLIQYCSWLGEQFECRHMFVHLATSEGFCCSFNWHGKATEFDSGLDFRKKTTEKQWHKQGIFKDQLYVREAGTAFAGLSLVVNTRVDEHFSSINSFLGAAVIVHHPERFPDVSARRIFVQPKFEMNIRVTVRVVESDDNVRSLSPRERRCYFQDEVAVKTGRSYSYESCILDCKLARYVEKCGCVPFYYPYFPNTTTVCDLQDWACLYRNKAIFSGQVLQKGENETSPVSAACDCLPSCTDNAYEFSGQGNKVYIREYASPEFETDLENKSAFNVFFQDNVCIKYSRVSQIRWDSMLASFGGILGLYLGGSVVSVIELAYYVFFKLWQPAKKPNPGRISNKMLQRY